MTSIAKKRWNKSRVRIPLGPRSMELVYELRDNRKNEEFFTEVLSLYRDVKKRKGGIL